MRPLTFFIVFCLSIAGVCIYEETQNERDAAVLLQEIEALKPPTSSACVDGWRALHRFAKATDVTDLRIARERMKANPAAAASIVANAETKVKEQARQEDERQAAEKEFWENPYRSELIWLLVIAAGVLVVLSAIGS